MWFFKMCIYALCKRVSVVSLALLLCLFANWYGCKFVFFFAQSLLMYCNSIFASLPATEINHLQRVPKQCCQVSSEEMKERTCHHCSRADTDYPFLHEQTTQLQHKPSVPLTTHCFPTFTHLLTPTASTRSLAH